MNKWKLLGLAGLAGVAATGVIIARDERRRAQMTPEQENAVLKTIARLDGTPFPPTAALAGRWLRGRFRRPAPVESTYCAEVVATTYQAMGLLDGERPTNWYDPGSFWSGDELDLTYGHRLGNEIRIEVPPPTSSGTFPHPA